MQEFIARQNVARFRRQLSEAGDPVRRETLARLLAEAEAQLFRHEAGESPDAQPQAHPRAAGDHASASEEQS